ncbi:tryptophan halogenase family protein [Shewanella intestini]|uniref:Tryptophan 7-halogenase n=1 Tax=Shewanella intestini TaxID=2017544 RepID=A0ABS5HY57_9GAMM|nr:MULTISPECIES: tryptophan halogenase family protein [Shewanella]MBR9726703.1 tryptophan 7-halogenase [Shewanella intestini]MRG34731.1 tryptophan 7-halogenase [Shewanella sp. XMDDZSB0408]
MKITNVAIIGGGTAGWLAANHLGLALTDSPVNITLIESPNIPIIGVGEGTVPAIRQTLQRFGISETALFRQCDATFKQSIKFQNWLDKSRHGEENFYHHLFDAPNRFDEQATARWQQYASTSECAPYAQTVAPQFAACESFKAPKTITTAEYESVCGYAYHLNAAKFALLLANNAKDKFNVKHIKANVLDATLTQDGAIASLYLDNKGEQTFDFYIDCSGFESVLHAKKLHSEFVDKSHQLFVNQAIVAQVPTDKLRTIPPFTLATAHQAGWIWDIALPERRGVGLVYCDKYMSTEAATQKMMRYLERTAQGQSLGDITLRHIPMQVGYRKECWNKNCVALGLAQGFLEPIEATSILLTDFAADYLAKRFPKHQDDIPMLATRFNRTMTYAWERVVDFAKLHYCLSDRIDSPFWVDNRRRDSIPSSLQQKLNLWQTTAPITDDFFSRFEVFNLDNYLYVLHGMKFPVPKASLAQPQAQTSTATDKQKALNTQQDEFVNRINTLSQQMISDLPDHRALIEKISQYGLQKI